MFSSSIEIRLLYITNILSSNLKTNFHIESASTEGIFIESDTVKVS